MLALMLQGLTHDQGEGHRWMFAEMPITVLPAQRIRPTPRSVITTLTEADRAFVARLAAEDLSQDEFRALLQAHRHTKVENASLRNLMGLDTLALGLAPNDRGQGGGSQVDRGELESDRGDQPSDRGDFELDRGELIDPKPRQAIALLGARPRKQRLRQVIIQLCSDHWRTGRWLANQLHLDPGNLAERHQGPMVKAGSLERRFPASPNHPEQACRASLIQVPLLTGTTAGGFLGVGGGASRAAATPRV